MEDLTMPIAVPPEVTEHVPEHILVLLSGGAILIVVSLALFGVLVLIGWWRIFAKAEEPGWAILVPFWNLWVFIQIIQRSNWWFLPMLIPIVNIFVGIYLSYALGRVFGKGPLWSTIFLVLLQPIGVVMLGFSDDEYQEYQEFSSEAQTPQTYPHAPSHASSLVHTVE